jgi:hypothetical protein
MARASLLALVTATVVTATVVTAQPTGAAAPDAEVDPAVASYLLEGRYDVSLHLAWAERRVRVTTRLDLLNTSGGPVDRLELNSAAARLGAMRGLHVTVDGVQAQARIVGQTITVRLPGPLAEGGRARVWLAYRARLGTRVAGRAYWFAKLGGVVQLYRFIPWLSRTIRFGAQGHGEPFLTPVSPRVRVTVSADRKLVWATTGQPMATDPDGPRPRPRQTFVARDVRDFAIVASPAYRTARGTSRDGDTVILAYALGGGGRRLVELAARELARFERITGVPYPYPAYRIAESGGGLPMEAPALIWIPAARGPAEQPFLVSHETAHQWWYGIVGNDQSTDAFADEAMADYFARRAHLSIRPSRCQPDRLDGDIRDYSGACYFEVIYVQGARFLDRLRRDFGTRRFARAIRAYTRAHRLGIGSNLRLLEAFRAEMGDGVLPRYRRRFPSLY